MSTTKTNTSQTGVSYKCCIYKTYTNTPMPQVTFVWQLVCCVLNVGQIARHSFAEPPQSDDFEQTRFGIQSHEQTPAAMYDYIYYGIRKRTCHCPTYATEAALFILNAWQVRLTWTNTCSWFNSTVVICRTTYTKCATIACTSCTRGWWNTINWEC
jgi:hypothetical protein